MKKCPQCQRSYRDEAQNFCLDDGTVLVSENAPATDENIARPTEQRTELISHEKLPEIMPTQYVDTGQTTEQETIVHSNKPTGTFANQPQLRKGVSPIFAYLSVGLLGLIVLITGVAVVVWFSMNSSGNNELAANLSNESNVKKAENKTSEDEDSDTSDETSADKPVLKNTPVKETKPVQKPNPTPKPADSNPPTPKPSATPEPDNGKFFVILGSFPQSQSGKARLRLQEARSKGLNARIVNTNNYPGLRNGLVAVVMGPFSKSAAQGALRSARSVSSDAYVKSGS
jgi:cell division septation protein DedD